MNPKVNHSIAAFGDLQQGLPKIQTHLDLCFDDYVEYCDKVAGEAKAKYGHIPQDSSWKLAEGGAAVRRLELHRQMADTFCELGEDVAR